MLSAAARMIYTALIFVLSFVAVPFFMLKARGRARLLERFGVWNLPQASYVWFHGASMGEINGILPVIRELRRTYPEQQILLTATSVTGIERAGPEVQQARLAPFDCVWFLRRALGASQIKAFIITETELWPGLIYEAKRRGARLCLVNAIVSDYSIGWYRLLRPLLAPLLKKFDSILCSGETSRARLVELGASEDTALVTGNSKYDIQPSVKDEAGSVAHKRNFFPGSTDSVLVLGSLRPGEEQLWFPEVARALAANKRLSVVVAPRHKEKFEFFARQLRDFSIPFRRWTAHGQGAEQERVLLLDTYGDLEAAYSFADVAFVGGSLVDWGGHNPLEPACYGAYLAMGPYARNVSSIVAELEACGALRRISAASEIRELLDEMQNAPAQLKVRGENGRKVWQRHRGATKKIVERVEGLLQ